MSTVTEDRLTAALQARADGVQPEDLRHLSRPAPTTTPVWRRPVVVALVAAAAVLAVVVPLATRGDHAEPHPLPSDHHWPPPPHHPQPTPTLTHHLSGDIDGDGRPDQVRQTGRTVTVTLAADPAHPLTQTEPDLGGLVGLADFGGRGRAIVESIHNLVNGSEWQAYALRAGRLRLTLVKADGGASSVSVVPGYATSWLTPAGVLMNGRLDPMQKGEVRLAVQAGRVEPRSGGQPVLTPLGRWCWDTVTQDVPAPCPPGVTDAFDPGPRGSLPQLLPRNDADSVDTTGTTWQEGSTSLRLVEGPVHAGSSFNQVFDVAGTIGGHDVSARAGVFDPILFTRFVDLGHGVRGLVVDNRGATYPSWTVLALVDHRLVPLPVPGGGYALRPGSSDVVFDGRGHAGYSWIDPDGRVLTTVETGGPGQDELYEWQVTDGSATTLVAEYLGHACIDDFWGTYGTC